MKPRLNLITVSDGLQMHSRVLGKGYPDRPTRPLMKNTNNTQKVFTIATMPSVPDGLFKWPLDFQGTLGTIRADGFNRLYSGL